MPILIREATAADFDQIWPIFHEVASVGETYGYSTDTTRDQAFHLWMEYPRCTYVAEEEGQVLGTYYIKTNNEGPGAHVCNCGYMVDPTARGRGIASALCQHSQQQARLFGFTAMQFNAVVATNIVAVKLWQQLGFAIVGTIPDAYQHRLAGLVDCHVMYKSLGDDA